MIEIKNLTKKFGSTVSLDAVSIEFQKNDSIALMGANGAGKTTLEEVESLVNREVYMDLGKVVSDEQI